MSSRRTDSSQLQPDRTFLASQIRWARGRGIPAQDAEDIVFDAYHKAREGFDPERGSFEAYMQAVVRSSCAYWWRRKARTERAHGHLRLVPDPADRTHEERAFRNQSAMLEALTEEERKVFAAWALQKHLGKGQTTSADMGRSIGLAPKDYENAKRRLKDQLNRLLDQFGWSVRGLLYGDDDVDQTG